MRGQMAFFYLALGHLLVRLTLACKLKLSVNETLSGFVLGGTNTL